MPALENIPQSRCRIYYESMRGHVEFGVKVHNLEHPMGSLACSGRSVWDLCPWIYKENCV